MITLKIANAKLARWLCETPPRPATCGGQILVLVGDGNAYGWPIDPKAWDR